MATSSAAAAAMRHTILGPSDGGDRPRESHRLTRNASLPSQFQDPRAATRAASPSDPSKTRKPIQRQRTRPSGLFESSESSSAAEEDDPAAALPTDLGPPRSPPLMTRRATTAGSASTSSGVSDRKGLFETVDDDADSVEKLRERVKLRQKKKATEILGLRTELDAALARATTLEEELIRERREKDEFAIRMDECQRILEKRNKQLLKASEKLTRLGEQSESLAKNLQQQIQDLETKLEESKERGAASERQLRETMEAQFAEHRRKSEAQIERLTQISEATMKQRDAEEMTLKQRIRELEADVVGAVSRIAQSEEYQVLLKRCEDAEAIARGLRFQLEKAQNEKRFLKKQLSASIVSPAHASACFPSPDTQSIDYDRVNNGDRSPASSVASADLSSFDFFPVTTSLPMSSSNKEAESYSGSQAQTPQNPTTESTYPSTAPRPTSSQSSVMDGNSSHEGNAQASSSPPPPPPPCPPTVTEERQRPGSGSINFFEKISIKFKRSSPRGSLNSKTVEQQPAMSQSSLPSASTPIDIPASRAHVLKRRPKMYVAKSPSDYEESSDSIFGSDSESDSSISSSDSEPPPPPPLEHASAIEHNQQREVPDSSEDDANPSSANVSVASDREDLRKVMLPSVSTPPNIRAVQPPVPSNEKDAIEVDSSSSESGSEAKPAASQATASRNSKSLRSFSSSESEDERAGRRRRRVVTEDDGGAQSKTLSPADMRDRSRSIEDGAGAGLSVSKTNRMNEYMEARAKKRQEKLKKKEERENAEHQKREEYEKEWERMAQEERERRRKQQAARRTGKRRPSSKKTVRVSQMRQQLNKHHHPKDHVGKDDDEHAGGESSDDDDEAELAKQRQSDRYSSDSDDLAHENEVLLSRTHQDRQHDGSPPLPPEPTTADTELYIRQQARLRERHEMEMKKKMDAEQADQVRGQIHRRVEMWAFGKELLHMILTLDEITTNDTLKNCQLMVVHSPDNDTLRKAYRSIIRVIHPDKLRGATIAEQLEAKELFTVLNLAFEQFKNQTA